MSTQEDFQAAVKYAKLVRDHPDATNQDKLELYALSQQLKEGDCNTSRPGMLDLKGRAKWDAWNAKKGMPQAEAKQKFIDFVWTLKRKYKLA